MTQVVQCLSTLDVCLTTSLCLLLELNLLAITAHNAHYLTRIGLVDLSNHQVPLGDSFQTLQPLYMETVFCDPTAICRAQSQ
jgi:hypothetical protein